MRRIVFFALIAMLAGTTGFALAEGDKNRHVRASVTQTISTESMTRKIDELGYDVLRLEMDDGFFRAHIVDRASGGGVEATFDPATGELVRAKPAS